MQKWVKRGRIFIPKGQASWVITHGMLPTPYYLHDDLYRIYFSGRDKHNHSAIGYVEIDIKNPIKILRFSKIPVLTLGSIGSFDDSGVSPLCLVPYGKKLYLYYLGWNKGSQVKVSEVSGLAISKDDGLTFVRYSNAPILDRTSNEPYLILAITSILVENGIWRMWYDGCDGWINKRLPHYNIKYAESKNGIVWKRKGYTAVDYEYPFESRVSKACVINEDKKYKMWYCYAIDKSGYRMGYAESDSGVHFIRKDKQVGISVSKTGWDSEMICYPSVFVHKNKKYMLYCGNGYGKTGFGYATLED